MNYLDAAKTMQVKHWGLELMQQLCELDGGILLWIQENLRTDLMTVIMKAVTKLGDRGIFWITAAVLFLLFKSTRKTGLALSAGLVINTLIVNMWLKNMVGRIRPYEVVEGLKCLIIPEPVDSSFPSGHASHAFVAVVVIWIMMSKKFGIIALVISALMAWSRLYLGAHYPSDVLAGILIGIIAGVAGIIIVRSVEKRKGDNKEVMSKQIDDN